MYYCSLVHGRLYSLVHAVVALLLLWQQKGFPDIDFELVMRFISYGEEYWQAILAVASLRMNY